MKAKRRIAWLLSFLMVFSLIMGSSKVQIFAVGGAGETATFVIRESNGQTGTVQYKLNGSGDFTTANNTPVNLEGATSITIKVIPTGEAKVNQNYSGISGTERTETFDYDALITESGWTYNIQDNDGNITFTIEFDNNDGTGGGENPGGGEVNNGNAVHANVTVNISGEELEYDAPWSNDAADFIFGINGAEMRRLSKEEVNYTTEGDKIVGLATKEALGYEYNYDDSGNVTFNIKTQWDDVITSLTINGVPYDTPQTKDDLINAFDADWRGIRFDIENVPYAEEYHIVVEGRKQTQDEKIMGNFGWTYDPNSNEYSDDDKILYGNLEFVEAKYNGVTYDSIEEVNEAGGTFQWDDGVKGTDDPTGDAMFPTGTELTLRLIPDAGYQLTSLDLNGTPFEPGEEVGLYTFTIGGGNWHLGAQFTQVGAEVQASSVNIKSGNIDINENFEYGTAKLEVSDVASMDSSRIEEFENTATDEGYEIENYLDISLYNAVYKGGTKDVNGNYESWDTPVENIENKAAITLELENDMSGKDLAVIHELHNGEEIIGYELINATYNEENNTITFESDSFSHYAIVSKGIGEGENVYYIDLGTGSWTVGDVTVSAPEGMSGVVSILDTETIPTEMLANFDPETMDITLTVSDGFVIYLEIDENGNTTLASTRDGVELPPYGETLTFAVVEKASNPGGGGNDGGEGEGTYTVWFGEGSWEIGDVTVTTNRTDVQHLTENDIITLQNFDAETMEARVDAEDGFWTTLAVTDGQTSISAHTNDGGVPTDIVFSVVEKSSNPGGGGNDGGEGENVYYIDLGTGSWTVGDVIVSAPEGMSGVVSVLDTETIPTEMLANFDPETMDITLTVSDGFVIYLEIDENGNTTLASTRDGVELPPYGETLTFAVVEKSSNPGGEGENVYYIDLGTGSWTVGDVTVSAPEGMSGVVSILDTETIPTEMLANFDPETMDITLTVSDGFVIYLEIDENGNTTLASTRDGVELPPYGATLTFAVVAKPGNMEIVDKTEENVCNADLAELTDDLISKLLTDAEKTRLENGEEVKVWIEATDISASVSQTDKDLIDSKKGNTTIGMYLDIDLLKQIGSDSPVNITDTDGAVTITLKVPSSLINLNSSVTRTYQMIKVHNGVATVIPCTYDAANQTISCETDQFSTYALAYVDQQNNNVKDEVPNTGDASNAYVWFILALVSGIGALYFGKKGLVLKKEN